VFGRNFIARDMNFRNTVGPQMHQAVTLMTSADKFTVNVRVREKMGV